MQTCRKIKNRVCASPDIYSTMDLIQGSTGIPSGWYNLTDTKRYIISQAK